MADDPNRAPPQGGVLEGSNPSEYNPLDPIVIFIIQAGLIIIMCHLLHWPLSKIRQPRVIAEVIGGIVLGPSVMGRIPGFSEAIFPKASIPNLTLVANLGLVIYLFIIGLETDIGFLLSNWRVATSVSIAGLALPFGVGCALAWGVYNQFSDDEGILHIDFPIYMLFVGVAIAITAFPVLCRILTELKLLETSVGVITLSAGVANDVVGWILLALCVALANAGNGLTALWILLACAGYMIFLVYAVRIPLAWLLRRTGNIENGPSQSMISLILLLALASAFFTAIIGVHAIFGGFMVGLIIPRDRNFNIKVLEKLEDLIGALFLPLYFTLSGLKTNIGLLDSGITWAYVFAVTFTAFFTKVIGATLGARVNGLVWRESFTIGALMSCKGLVELIVLNIGLQANILSTRTFTIFVVMALLTTFATTPLVSFLYPPSYQRKLEAWKRGEIDWDTGAPISGGNTSGSEGPDGAKHVTTRINRMLVYLRLDNMPSTLMLVSLFGKQSTPDSSSDTTQSIDEKNATTSVTPTGDSLRTVRAHGLRLLPLGDRESNVMTVSQVDEYSNNDTVLNIFRTVGQFLRIAVSGEAAVMPEARFAEALLTKSSDIASDLVLVPWSETGNLGDSLEPSPESSVTSSPYTQFASTILGSTDQNVGIFFPRGTNTPTGEREPSTPVRKMTRAYSFSDLHRDIPIIPVANVSHHIFVPFLGGVDDDFALSLALQLCEKNSVTATIFQIVGDSADARDLAAHVTAQATATAASRITVETVTAGKPLDSALGQAMSQIRPNANGITWQNLIILGRHTDRTAPRTGNEVKDCLGAMASKFIDAKIKADLLVVQARASR
ncbi:K+/H+ antiporter 1 [Plectosphaerella cucumerina]|uniref:K+/H+ antiporter 1 n=1 Tax=Plectosphaerella cucumerina TaxID=40658 RepID=A0A8K0X448_9PEZI|nr:K+/H+ antiporter 1 [Plectosphaerella cucumerina]